MMIDLGKKSSGIECCKPSEDTKDKKYYPSLYIDGKEMNISKEMFGKDVEIKAIVRVKGESKRTDEKGKITGSVDLEFRKIDFGNQIKEKSISEAIIDAMDDEEEK